MSKLIVVLLHILIQILVVVNGRNFASHFSKWFRPRTERQSMVQNVCQKFRGGSSSDDKIKGVCIGIDLGTTYR